jgi:hypothetical protein
MKKKIVNYENNLYLEGVSVHFDGQIRSWYS